MAFGIKSVETFITQVFRPHVVTEEFLFSYGTILVSNAEFFFLFFYVPNKNVTISTVCGIWCQNEVILKS